MSDPVGPRGVSDPTGPADTGDPRALSRVAARLASRREGKLRVHPGPVPDPDRMGVGTTGKSGALRAGIFGVNDGLVSNLSLIMGFAGAAVQNNVILLAGVAGLLAGAFSMGAGEYVSMRVQRELFERLLHLEAHELATEPDEELEELKAIYEAKGFPGPLAEQVATVIMQDPEVALQTHAREELGLDPDELGSPWAAAGVSFMAFVVGAVVPMAPFIFASGSVALLAAIVASSIALFAVGAAMSVITGRNAVWSGLRMLLIGGAAAAITFGVGRLLHVS